LFLLRVTNGSRECSTAGGGALRAPLTAPFNRNFRDQEIDGEWRRPLRFEPAGRPDGLAIAVI
jgi:hypothetical protein